MNICVIPARGGSKRIPRKNIKQFNGKPVIAYSIEAAKQSGCFDKIIVSTDDRKIAEVANQYGAETPFVRPAELSNDFVGIMPVTKHAINWVKENNSLPKFVCCLYATVPFISAKLIIEAYNKLLNTDSDFVFAATRFSAPIEKAIRINSNEKVEVVNSSHYNTRSQDFEEFYHDAGQLCWGKMTSWQQKETVFAPYSTAIILPSYLVQDIDSIEDWKKAEIMYKVMLSDGIL